jgi:ribosomal protein L7Ae-like RNA K-turn-binding protein
VARAPGGLGRTLRRPVSTSGAALHAALCEASGRRLLGLLLAAARTKRLAVGSLAVRAALEANEAEIIVVATDARAAAHTSWVEAAVAAGRAVAFGTKDQLGKLLSRDEAGVLAVLDAGMARALRRAAEIAQMAAPATGSKRERAGDRRLDE